MKNDENANNRRRTMTKKRCNSLRAKKETWNQSWQYSMPDVVAKLIKSGRWRTRDAALMEMNTVLLSATVTVEDANQFFVSVCRVLAQKCLCDKIASAFIRVRDAPQSVHILLRENKF